MLVCLQYCKRKENKISTKICLKEKISRPIWSVYQYMAEIDSIWDGLPCVVMVFLCLYCVYSVLICINLFVFLTLKGYRLKVSTFIYRHLQGNPGQQRFTIQSGILTGSDTSGAAQVAAAHCPNERTLGPHNLQPDRPTYAPVNRTMAFTPQCSPAVTHYF